MSPKPVLIIMARQPRMGKVKTRLARQIGNAPAFLFYRNLLRRLIRQSMRDPRWETHIAFTEDFYETEETAQCHVIIQKRGTLGERLLHIMHLFAHRPCIIMGSDSPHITNQHIALTCRALQSHHAVLGPALDGGYYLIGLRALLRKRRMFQNVRWSSPHALQDTIQSLRRVSPQRRGGFKVAYLERLADIDDAQDYKRWKSSERLQGR